MQHLFEALFWWWRFQEYAKEFLRQTLLRLSDSYCGIIDRIFLPSFLPPPPFPLHLKSRVRLRIQLFPVCSYLKIIYVLNFANSSFCICWDEHIVFLLSPQYPHMPQRYCGFGCRSLWWSETINETIAILFVTLQLWKLCLYWSVVCNVWK